MTHRAQHPVTVVTDGACSGNGTADARGGWAAIVVAHDGSEVVLTGTEVPSTNNRMELTAVIEGLAATPAGSTVELVTDSSYVALAISAHWLDAWQRRDWRTAGKKPVANRDLWERLLTQMARHASVSPRLVRGHAGHEMNERVDQLAQDAAATAVAAPPVTEVPAPSVTEVPAPSVDRSTSDDQMGFDLD
ncbi:MAG: ribonuclease HI [Thermoleophilia bacterium]|nr:ribonuclease HI [Thermoleophilia bacterium]